MFTKLFIKSRPYKEVLSDGPTVKHNVHIMKLNLGRTVRSRFSRILLIGCCFWACLIGVLRILHCFHGSQCEFFKNPNYQTQQGSIVLQDCQKPEELKQKKYEGKLNVHRWFDSCTCGFTIDGGLRIYTSFPRRPEFESTTYGTELTTKKAYSQRIFGYITPNRTGIYRFAVSSNDNSELWISKDSSPKKAELVAYVGDPTSLEAQSTDFLRQYDLLASQKSLEISLQKGQDYYIEALHRNQKHIGHISIAWQKPGTFDFVPIESGHLSLYLPDDDEDFPTLFEHKECILQDHKPLNLRTMPLITSEQLLLEKDDICVRYPLVVHNEVASVLHACPYQPSYMPKHRLRTYEGANYYAPHWLTDVYPEDKTSVLSDRHGNRVISKQEVDDIVDEYMKKLTSSKGQKYRLKKVVNVERKTDELRGNRFLLELELETVDKGQSVLLSEYVFKFNKTFAESSSLTTDLCYPEGFHWNSSAKVYIILPVKNYGYWVKYLIDELIKIYVNTPEKNFHLVLIDFNSTDFSAKEYLENSVLRDSFTALEMTGSFHKSQAINDGAAKVKDPNSILFLMDLHLTIPPCFFDIIRKHTIRGKSGFFPDILRLNCAKSEKYPQGYWGLSGYGLAGVYKEDWDRFGGENVERFKFNWGGEDWDLLDRVLNAKLESERFKWPKLFHFPHSRTGDWYRWK